MRRSYAFADPRSACACCAAGVNTRLELFIVVTVTPIAAPERNKDSLSLLLTVGRAN